MVDAFGTIKHPSFQEKIRRQAASGAAATSAVPTYRLEHQVHHDHMSFYVLRSANTEDRCPVGGLLFPAADEFARKALVHGLAEPIYFVERGNVKLKTVRSHIDIFMQDEANRHESELTLEDTAILTPSRVSYNANAIPQLAGLIGTPENTLVYKPQ